MKDRQGAFKKLDKIINNDHSVEIGIVGYIRAGFDQLLVGDKFDNLTDYLNQPDMTSPATANRDKEIKKAIEFLKRHANELGIKID